MRRGRKKNGEKERSEPFTTAGKIRGGGGSGIEGGQIQHSVYGSVDLMQSCTCGVFKVFELEAVFLQVACVFFYLEIYKYVFISNLSY